MARGEPAEVDPAVRAITGEPPRDVVPFARDSAGASRPLPPASTWMIHLASADNRHRTFATPALILTRWF
jgi:hypothetical protein